MADLDPAVELVARAIQRHAWRECRCQDGSPESLAGEILDAAREAGYVLLPPGGEVREQWGARHETFGVDGPIHSANGDDEALARRLVASSGGSLTLVRRVTSDWREVTP